MGTSITYFGYAFKMTQESAGYGPTLISGLEITQLWEEISRKLCLRTEDNKRSATLLNDCVSVHIQ